MCTQSVQICLAWARPFSQRAEIQKLKAKSRHSRMFQKMLLMLYKVYKHKNSLGVQCGVFTVCTLLAFTGLALYLDHGLALDFVKTIGQRSQKARTGKSVNGQK